MLTDLEVMHVKCRPYINSRDFVNTIYNIQNVGIQTNRGHVNVKMYIFLDCNYFETYNTVDLSIYTLLSIQAVPKSY